jgi:uncharacterized protein (DUF2147 family)
MLLLSVVLFSSQLWADANDDRVIGQWTTPEGKSTMEIYTCGDRLCGKIVALKEPFYPADEPDGYAGKAKVDRENPDDSKRSTPLIGLQIMRGFQYVGENVWSDGEIYDPENGKSYSCNMTLVDEQTLEVRGYIGFSWIGRTSVWTR